MQLTRIARVLKTFWVCTMPASLTSRSAGIRILLQQIRTHEEMRGTRKATPWSNVTKHIEELIKANKKGYEIYIVFIVQREDCNQFAIASDIDPEYSKLLFKAVKKKLNILCYDCKFSAKGIKLNKKIKFKIQ